MPGEKIHQSHSDSAARTYERLRQGGVPADSARRVAQDAATQTHRAVDKQHSDKKPKPPRK